MLVKIYGCDEDDDSRYSPSEVIECRPIGITGKPDPKHISTSFVDRQNLRMRIGMRRFTRLTNAFSKKVENHATVLWQRENVTPEVWMFEPGIAIVERDAAVGCGFHTVPRIECVPFCTEALFPSV